MPIKDLSRIEDNNEYATELAKLAAIDQRNQHYLLVEGWKRNGYSSGIADLVGKDEDTEVKIFADLGIRAKAERKWKLVGLPTTTLVTIQPGFTPDQLKADYDEIHRYLDSQLENYGWYQQTDNVESFPASYMPNPHPNAQSFVYNKVKTLGKRGPNAAVDPIFKIVAEDGSVRILGGKRFSGEYALPGGMAEAGVRTTCLNEVLEEVYGGSLFSVDEETKKPFENTVKTDAMIKNNNAEFIKRVDACMSKMIEDDTKAWKMDLEKLKALPTLNVNEQARKNNLEKQIAKTTEIYENIRSLLKSDGDIQEKFAKVSAYLQSEVDKGNIKPADKNKYMIHTKCKLYEHVLPDEFKILKDLVYGKLEKGDQVCNQSDPRNTSLAHMVTTPISGTITIQELRELEKKCGLSMKGGDDLDVPGLIRIEDMAFAYSDHLTLALNSIAKDVASGVLKLTPALRKQMEVLSAKVIHKEEYIEKKVHVRITELLADKEIQADKEKGGKLDALKAVISDANQGVKSADELNAALDKVKPRSEAVMKLRG